MPNPASVPPSLARCAQLACTLEVLARKPGNVHPYQNFADVTLTDFLRSAVAIAPVLEHAVELGVGATVLEAIRATRQVTTTNTNLGIVLLLAPLARVPIDLALASGVEQVLGSLTNTDAALVYQAIRLAQPGGLGRASEQDVAEPPTLPLREIMGLAAERDLIARQYTNGYQEVFQIGLPALLTGLERGWPVEDAIIYCQLELLSKCADSLIIRKRGCGEACEARRRAAVVLGCGWPETALAQRELLELDGWLRAVGHQRNPGATADLVTACLFAALLEGRMHWPPTVGFASERILLGRTLLEHHHG
jgi:triphosphoribosyl-dephospho-CoA synthase